MDSITVTFTGDIAFTGYFSNNNELFPVDETIRSFLLDSDEVVANIEAPITNAKKRHVRTIEHQNEPECVQTLSKMGITVWNLGNNHIMDCEEEGLNDTLQEAYTNQIKTIGAGKNIQTAIKPIILGNGKVKVGIFSVTKEWRHVVAKQNKGGTVGWDNLSIISETVSILRKKVDWIVVCVHGGYEFTTMPVPLHREKYKELLNMGVDIVVGHHPHVPQVFEQYDNKAVFYSLGNFIFDTDFQRDHKHTDLGVLLKIHFSKDSWTYDCLGTKTQRGQSVVFASELPLCFSSVTDEEYEHIKAYCIKEYIKNHRLVKQFFHPLLKKKRRIEWAIFDVKRAIKNTEFRKMYFQQISMKKKYSEHEKQLIRWMSDI